MKQQGFHNKRKAAQFEQKIMHWIIIMKYKILHKSWGWVIGSAGWPINKREGKKSISNKNAQISRIQSINHWNVRTTLNLLTAFGCTPKNTFLPHFSFFWVLSYIFQSKNIIKAYFDQGLECAAPKRLSKYTTSMLCSMLNFLEIDLK